MVRTQNKPWNLVDFLTIRNRQPELLVEVKQSDGEFSKLLLLFSSRLKPKKTIQVVHLLKREKSIRDAVSADVVRLADWLASLEA